MAYCKEGPFPTTESAKACNLSPGGSLPFDVLSQIFLECLPENGFPTPSTKVAPTLLTRICRHWRGVALRTPPLWARLDLGDYPTNTKADYLTDALAAEEWKIRAGSCLLSYRLWYDRPGLAWTGVLDAILPHHKQWKHLEGHLPVLACGWIHSAISRGAPNLQYLEIDGDDSHSSSTELPILGFPKLHSLFLKLCGFMPIFADTAAPLLRTVVLNGSCDVTLDDYWRVLQHCPNLEIFAGYCEARKPLTLHSALKTSKFLESRHLKTLYLMVHSIHSGQLLDHLDAPGLDRLELADYHTDRLPGPLIRYPQLRSFFIRSGAQLTSMNIDVDITEDEFLASLLHLPALISLELHDKGLSMTAGILDTLVMQPMNPQIHIIPLLECITFTNFRQWKSGSIANIAVSRWGGINGTGSSTTTTNEPSVSWERRLRCIRLRAYSMITPCSIAEIPNIKACIQEGLEVTEVYAKDHRFSASS
ncbi:hypothetical protein BD410DRAFT_896184 [Rickenella mellea]|uniref:Uncharacterized protein n=1 Tax=Rickenella mellea TaxID=50990 RepID=A0A4Y7QEG9_9AGAM|nr:hypothetical protein BD410DRAFT_896184 [Rickenella mellea]